MSGRAAGTTRRTAWLLLGAAIGLAVVLLAVSVAAVLGEAVPAPAGLRVTLCLLPVALLGLVPGVRGLEVEAARSMLEVHADLVDPARPGPQHRWRSATWVVLHLALGLLAAALLFGILPGVVVTAYSALRGSTVEVAGVTLPSGAGAAGLVLLLSVVAVALALAGTVGVGVLARRWAPAFLGPTPGDRLLVAETRLAAESEHTRLARELHDGIGHSLTIINVQAAAARRSTGDPAAALEVIESTAQTALTELDSMLGLLRDGPAARQPEPDLGSLEGLVEVYRGSGMRLATDLVALDRPPALASRTAYRIVSEALSNAQRHGGAGEVELRVDGSGGQVRIDVWNPPGGRRSPTRRGHGLDGVTERVRLFGGTASSGPGPTGRWHLQVSFPTGAPR